MRPDDLLWRECAGRGVGRVVAFLCHHLVIRKGKMHLVEVNAYSKVVPACTVRPCLCQYPTNDKGSLRLSAGMLYATGNLPGCAAVSCCTPGRGVFEICPSFTMPSMPCLAAVVIPSLPVVFLD